MMGDVNEVAAEFDAAEREWLQNDTHSIVLRGSDAYPELLDRIGDPPERLFVSGDPEFLHLPALAIVGSRNPTRGGERNAFEFARYLADCGFLIVSGLAQGIDAAAHRGALAVNRPTVAFLGHGIDCVYPAQHEDLAGKIAGNGALVSEFPLGMGPRRSLFPQRNRLISGLSLGTIVIEAAKRSGSLITARLAAEQGREVFALPGSIHNPLARGCHRLIKDGAKLVESVEDIVSELDTLTGHVLQQSTSPPHSTVGAAPGVAASGGAEYERLCNLMGHDPISIDELATRSGLTIAEVSSMLLILELDGIVEKVSGGRYALLS